MSSVMLEFDQTGLAVSADADADRRRSNRTDLIVRVDYSTVDEIFSEFTRDINEGGLFIETDKPKPMGTLVSMHFNLPGSADSIRTEGTVVRVTDGRDGSPPGMGIEFDALGREASIRINDIIRALRASKPEAGPVLS